MTVWQAPKSLKLADYAAAWASLAAALKTQSGQTLALDFAATQTLDSAAVALIIAAKRENANLSLQNLPVSLQSLIALYEVPLSS